MQTLDGFIAKSQEDNLSWGSKEDKAFFKAKTKEIGSMIMGSKTFNAMPKIAFKDRFCIVLTKNPKKYQEKEELKNYPSQISFLEPDIDLIKLELEKRNIEHIALIGGGLVNRFFLEKGLVNEIFITISPRLFLAGIPSFNQQNINELIQNDGKDSLANQQEIKLELLENYLINKEEILLHYKVLENE
jgi:dihydrofolate reductase